MLPRLFGCNDSTYVRVCAVCHVCHVCARERAFAHVRSCVCVCVRACVHTCVFVVGRRMSAKTSSTVGTTCSAALELRRFRPTRDVHRCHMSWRLRVLGRLSSQLNSNNSDSDNGSHKVNNKLLPPPPPVVKVAAEEDEDEVLAMALAHCTFLDKSPCRCRCCSAAPAVARTRFDRKASAAYVRTHARTHARTCVVVCGVCGCVCICVRMPAHARMHVCWVENGMSTPYVALVVGGRKVRKARKVRNEDAGRLGKSTHVDPLSNPQIHARMVVKPPLFCHVRTST